MLKRIYANHFRCLEKFEVVFNGLHNILLLGANGVGKTTLFAVLTIFKKIAEGESHIENIVQPSDFSFQRQESPIRFEIEMDIQEKSYSYSVAFEFPKGFKKLRILDEQLMCSGAIVFSRKYGQVQMPRKRDGDDPARFLVDWHMVALPIIQESSDDDPVHIARQYLSRMLVIAPVPAMMEAESSGEERFLDFPCRNFVNWLFGLLSEHPDAYSVMERFLRARLLDFKSFRNERIGIEARRLLITFSGDDGGSLEIPFGQLSDGEKCFLLSAAVIAANQVAGASLCFWDEPDNFLAISEVRSFVTALKKTFEHMDGQFVMTSHNMEALRAFAPENSIVLYRNSHMEPTRQRMLSEIQLANEKGNLETALISGDLYDE